MVLQWLDGINLAILALTMNLDDPLLKIYTFSHIGRVIKYNEAQALHKVPQIN